MALHGFDGWLALAFHPIAMGGVEMRGHGLIQRGQALIFLIFSAVNGGEGSGVRRTDARQVGGAPRFSELIVDFGEEGGRALAGA